MKIIALETLKNMPNGTVFCEIDKWGNLENDFRILTGRFENRIGFNGEMSLRPWVEGDNGSGIWNMFDENNELIKNKDIPTEWIATDTADHDYEKNQLFAVFSKAEAGKMIKALRWALSDLENDFDMNEVIVGDKIIRGDEG